MGIDGLYGSIPIDSLLNLPSGPFMQVNEYYESPFGDYWGQERAREEFFGYHHKYPPHEDIACPQSGNWDKSWGNYQVNNYGVQQTFEACQACGTYGHETHACPNVEWRYENGVWQSRLLPTQGHNSFYAGQEVEIAYDPYWVSIEANPGHIPSAHTDDYHIQQQYYEHEDMSKKLTSMENNAETCRNVIADMKTMMEQMMADLKWLEGATEKGDEPKNAEKSEKAPPAPSSMDINGSHSSIPIDTPSEKPPTFPSVAIDGFNPSIPTDTYSETAPDKESMGIDGSNPSIPIDKGIKALRASSSMEIGGSNPSIPIDSPQNGLHRAEKRYVPGSLKGTIPNKDVEKGKESAENTRGPVVMKEDDPDPIEEEALDMEISQLVECEKPIAHDLKLKVELTPLPESSQYVLPSTDDTEAVLIKHTDEVIWDIESIQSSEKKVDMPPERYSEYVPMFYGVYEKHDRGPQSSNKSKFLEPHNGLNSILRLTKRHTDAILDKRIVKEEWGASLSNTLPSSFCFKVLIDGIMDSQ
ncbi:hypothetical protein CASFOL_014129 [Castilleja foliolosa]|uniref:CCHC-type domain-containing protein n=1 Tax=Castilleja foliolosa TaxID=1961234 RepID=A0ABD3DQZ1_9LAMI